jgi:hypothetical protein
MKQLLFGDVIIVVITTAIIALTSLQVYSANDDFDPLVHIRVGDNEWVYELDQDRTVLIPGVLGDEKVIIDNGQVSLANYLCPCPQKNLRRGR